MALTATITRGKRKGETVELHQWCNDWVMLEEVGIMSPTSLQCGPEAIDAIIAQEEAGRNGQMFRMYYDLDHFVATGKFRWR